MDREDQEEVRKLIDAILQQMPFEEVLGAINESLQMSKDQLNELTEIYRSRD